MPIRIQIRHKSRPHPRGQITQLQSCGITSQRSDVLHRVGENKRDLCMHAVTHH